MPHDTRQRVKWPLHIFVPVVLARISLVCEESPIFPSFCLLKCKNIVFKLFTGFILWDIQTNETLSSACCNDIMVLFEKFCCVSADSLYWPLSCSCQGQIISCFFCFGGAWELQVLSFSWSCPVLKIGSLLKSAFCELSKVLACCQVPVGCLVLSKYI